MRPVAKTFLLALTASAFVVRPAPAATADDVDAAIAKAQSYLLARPGYVTDGHWESGKTAGRNGQTGGLTALVTYSLLASGVSANDPRLAKAIGFLRRADMDGTYAVGVRAQVWQYLPPTPDNVAMVSRDLRLLLRNMERSGARPDGGLFGYNASPNGRIDLSVSQYGTLGLWACDRLGAEVPFNTWKQIDTRWKGLQDKATGGWSYSGNSGAGTLAITAAGIATLYITLDALAGPPNDDGNAAASAIDAGIARLEAEWPSLVPAGGTTTNFYALYGVERIGVAGGYKLLRGIDWYAAGSEFLCRAISPEGNWEGEWGPEIDTAFALLFLARGREPVIMNKLKYDQYSKLDETFAEGRWNQRGRDVANVAQFVGRQMERSFNWQILDANAASVRDLHDAPIAYLSFRFPQVPQLAPETIEKLRAYVEGGGLLLVNGDAQPKDRDRLRAAAMQAATRPEALPAPDALVRLFASLFPDATFRRLPADHPILRSEQFKAATWQRPPVVYEATNGVRTLALYLADDPSLAWQGGEVRKEREKFELIADIYQYAIDKEHAEVKGRTHVAEAATSQPTVTSRVRVARIRFAGNCDPEPGGWRRVQTLAQNEGIEVVVEPVEIERDGVEGFAIAHLTGVGHVQLSPGAVERLKAFVAGGGRLLVDAAGGDATFAADIERALGPIADAFAPRAKPIPATDPLYVDAGRPPVPFGYRSFAIASVGASSAPRIRGTKVKGAWGVLYSPDDLSVGLVGQPVDGIRGYTPEAATEIVMRVIRATAK